MADREVANAGASVERRKIKRRIAMTMTPTNALNFVSFDSQFLSTDAQGLLSVFWDANVIGSIDERAVQPGLQHYTFTFPGTSGNGSHVLGIRIDPFTVTQSIAVVTNITLGIAGPSQPLSLSVTTNTISDLPVFQFTGQSGFTYTVEASTNLVSWDSVAALVNTNGSVRFFDPSPIKSSQRFYRVVAPYRLIH